MPSTTETMGVAEHEVEAGTCAVLPTTKGSSFLQPTQVSQDLKEYFQRQRVVGSGTVPTTRTSMFSADITRALLFTTWFPNGSVRLAGAQGVRFTAKFHVTVASAPFHQGLLYLSFQYACRPDDAETYPRYLQSALVTQLPGVYLNLQDSTTCTLEVPFVFPFDYMPLNGAINETLGTVALNTVLPYVTIPSSGAPTFKVYVSLHDLELLGSYPLASSTVVPQSGVRDVHQKKGATVQDKEKQKAGMVSKTLNAVANVADIAGRIPSLSVLGGTTSWLARTAAGVASSFGYATPDSEEPSKRIWRVDNIGDINIDVPGCGIKLSPFQSNSLVVDNVMGANDEDEMTFRYVLGKYCQIFVGDMATTDATGTRLYATQICPSNFWFRTSTARPGGNLPFPSSSTLTTNACMPSSICYFANMFRYWRGGLKFRFTFAKTRFHAGRVIVGFVPTTEDVSTSGIVSNNVPALEVAGGLPQPFSYSKIFDLKDDCQFEFEVPYISELLASNVYGSTGGLTMTVLDPLITANNTAAGTINYVVEVCAMDDFELFAPTPPSYTPVPGRGVVVYQSGIAGVSSTQSDVAQYTSGEKFNSLKQLMMIPSYISYDVANLTFAGVCLWPWFLRTRWTMATPMANTSSEYWGFTRAGNVAACYAFMNGSTTWHVYHEGSSGVSMFPYICPSDANSDVAGLASSRDKNNYGGAAIQVQTTGTSMHFTVPFYSKVARPTYGAYAYFQVPRNFSTAGAFGNSSTYSQSVAAILMRNTSGATRTIIMGRAAGEDARCAGYIGVPPVVLWDGTQTVSPDKTGPAVLGG